MNNPKRTKDIDFEKNRKHVANMIDAGDKTIKSNKKSSRRSTSATKKRIKKRFVSEKFPEIRGQTFSRALNLSEKSIVHRLDLKVQENFPSHNVAKNKEAAPSPIPASDKPFASVNDARRFLSLLENFVSSRNSSTAKKKSSSDSLYASRFVLSYIKMTKDFTEQKITLPKFINGFLLLFVKELLTDIESRINKAIEVLKRFNSFLPSTHHLSNEFPEICELLIMSGSASSKFEQVFTKQKLSQYYRKLQSSA